MSGFGRISSTASDGRHSLTPFGVTTIAGLSKSGATGIDIRTPTPQRECKAAEPHNHHRLGRGFGDSRRWRDQIDRDVAVAAVDACEEDPIGEPGQRGQKGSAAAAAKTAAAATAAKAAGPTKLRSASAGCDARGAKAIAKASARGPAAEHPGAAAALSASSADPIY